MTVMTAILGDIVKAVGLKGEVKLLPGPDFWSGALAATRLELVSRDDVRKVVTVERSRIKGNTYVLKLSGIENRDDAELAVGQELQVSMADVPEEDFPEALMPFQAVDAEVYLKDGTLLGTVVDMLLGPQQDCLIVEKDGERFIIPNVPEVVLSFDPGKGRFEIDPPEGLLELRY
jgi:16S rRNA processing protein RimM